jgi:hypothetical protein
MEETAWQDALQAQRKRAAALSVLEAFEMKVPCRET